MNTRVWLIALLILVAVLPVACGPSPTPTPTAVPTPLPTPTPTIPAPTATPPPPTPTATALPPTPTPTAAPPEPNAPTVQLVAPAPNQQVVANQTLQVVALAADDSGVIRVELWADNAQYASQSPPGGVLPKTIRVAFDWKSAIVGAHTLSVVAYDPSNNPSSPASVTVNIIADTSPPVASIQSPTSPQQVELGQQLQIQVIATDAAPITRLDLWVDSTLYTDALTPNPAGRTPFATTFVWTAQSVGNHTLIARAYDINGKAGDSPSLSVTVTDKHVPSISANYDRVNVELGGRVTVTSIAVDMSGIDRIELWADNALYNAVKSPNPSAQTSMTITQEWYPAALGDHPLFTRAFDTGGRSADSVVTNIHVYQPLQPTPTPRPTPTPIPPPPTPTSTPLPPPPPSAAILEPGNGFRGSMIMPLRVVYQGNGNTELREVELLAQYSGQPQPFVISREDARRTRDKRVTFDWRPSSTGSVDLFARAIDQFGQVGESPRILGVIQPPAPEPTKAPTPPPAPNIAGRWRGVLGGGAIGRGSFEMDLRPLIGCTSAGVCPWGGTFEDLRGTPTTGRISRGTFDGRTLHIEVDFAPVLVTLTFDGTLEADGTLSGTWSDSVGQGGTIVFHKQP